MVAEWRREGGKMTVLSKAGAPVSNTQTGISLCTCERPAQGDGWGSSSCVCQRSNLETNSFFHAGKILIPMTLS